MATSDEPVDVVKLVQALKGAGQVADARKFLRNRADLSAFTTRQLPNLVAMAVPVVAGSPTLPPMNAPNPPAQEEPTKTSRQRLTLIRPPAVKVIPATPAIPSVADTPMLLPRPSLTVYPKSSIPRLPAFLLPENAWLWDVFGGWCEIYLGVDDLRLLVDLKRQLPQKRRETLSYFVRRFREHLSKLHGYARMTETTLENWQVVVQSDLLTTAERDSTCRLWRMEHKRSQDYTMPAHTKLEIPYLAHHTSDPTLDSNGIRKSITIILPSVFNTGGWRKQTGTRRAGVPENRSHRYIGMRFKDTVLVEVPTQEGSVAADEQQDLEEQEEDDLHLLNQIREQAAEILKLKARRRRLERVGR
ncbi:hypothetical protein FB45DRAFT_913890 [Roridomyces roridus]|uniref:Uncharacterized protein n=1 Tax=Roridomyces roridus TaxID=1738132 RepID=A0AAD7BXC3_9AGAR|nr:hypothetical protein FB45DRAFT_913890 [Roridomyces roridus]